jgi:hypothetical protein
MAKELIVVKGRVIEQNRSFTHKLEKILDTNLVLR